MYCYYRYPIYIQTNIYRTTDSRYIVQNIHLHTISFKYLHSYKHLLFLFLKRDQEIMPPITFTLYIHIHIHVYFYTKLRFYSIRYIMYLTMYSFQIKLSISEITNYTKNKIMPLNMQQKERERERFFNGILWDICLNI